MKIEITKRGNMYAADCLELSGSPKVGMGLTKEAAVADLFVYMINRYPLSTKDICQSRDFEIIEK